MQKLASKKGLDFERRFTKEGINPFDEIEYVKRNSIITEQDGKVIYELKDIEVPKFWTQIATDILAYKYIRKAGVPKTGHETSARQVVHRIASTIRDFGEKENYFATKKDAEIFEAELSFMLINQYAAFNSPVWFNCGLHKYGIKGIGRNFYYDLKERKVKSVPDSYSYPQCSACFIIPVQDDLMSIFDLVKTEAQLFKFGSGTGTNFSTLRSKYEKLSGGGNSSGLISFLRVLDRGASATKSGGTTRRAAKMVILNIDHPEIEDFIWWKVKEERKVKALIDAGYPSDFNGEAYQTVSGQNANNSVRIPDSFMKAVIEDGKWYTRYRTTGEIHKEYKARNLMKQIAEAAWHSADPGVQFDDLINDWNTCINTERINGSNPCSEYHFLDNTACNLASLNLVKFLDKDDNFNIEAFKYACRLFITAQEIIVDMASYPTASIAERSHIFRTLGLGYANLGALLMIKGIPYDSEKSFSVSGAITAIMGGQSYKTSAEIASFKNPFEKFEENKECMIRVMKKHRDAAYNIDVRYCIPELLKAAREVWDESVEIGEKYGYRNAQTTVLAPTGTIALLMDCDTTGIEPDFSLVKWKKLAGGGYFKIVNNSIPRALKNLDYNEDQIKDIINYILGFGTLEGCPHINPRALKNMGFTEEQIKEAETNIKTGKSLDEFTPNINPKSLREKGYTSEQIKEASIYIGGAQTVEGSPHIKKEHIPVFDCANRCGIGKRFIAPMGHVKIMAAVQPFISGAMSKTVNLPSDAKVEEIENIYITAWELGIKCIALYRDGSKLSQPLSTKSSEEKEELNILKRGERRALPQKRHGFTIKSRVAGHKIFLRTGEYEDKQLGEIFIDMHKEGSAFRSLIGCFSMAVSIGLQYGVPLEKFVNLFTFTRFEPQGMTDHPNVRVATSILDFVFRVLGMEYLNRTDFLHVKPKAIDINEDSIELNKSSANTNERAVVKKVEVENLMSDAPMCSNCGHLMLRSGSCYCCLNCGNTSGCS